MLYLKKSLAVIIVLAVLAVISLPAIGATYLLAWLIDFLVTINFDSSLTHGVVIFIGVAWTLASINTDKALNALTRW